MRVKSQDLEMGIGRAIGVAKAAGVDIYSVSLAPVKKPGKHRAFDVRVISKSPLKFNGTIYVVGYDDFIKIGFSKTDVYKRIRCIEHGSPKKLRTYGTFPGSTFTEGMLHCFFGEYRLRGEWFKKKGTLKAWIESKCYLANLEGTHAG